MSRQYQFGRRKSDWLIPGLLILSLFIAVFWGTYNQIQKQNAEVMGKMTKAQVQIMDRLIQHHQGHRGKIAKSD